MVAPTNTKVLAICTDFLGVLIEKNFRGIKKSLLIRSHPLVRIYFVNRLTNITSVAKIILQNNLLNFFFPQKHFIGYRHELEFIIEILVC